MADSVVAAPLGGKLHASKGMCFSSNGGGLKSKSTSNPSPIKKKKKQSYRTFILDDAVFEVESRFKIKDIIGHGAYGVVW